MWRRSPVLTQYNILVDPGWNDTDLKDAHLNQKWWQGREMGEMHLLYFIINAVKNRQFPIAYEFQNFNLSNFRCL